MILVKIVHTLFVDISGCAFLESQRVFVRFDVTVSLDGATLSVFLEAGDDVDVGTIVIDIEDGYAAGQFPYAQSFTGVCHIYMGELMLFHGAQYVLVGIWLVVLHVVVRDVKAIVKGILADFQSGGSVIVLVFAGAKTKGENAK
jgi:hypothetical protein